MEDGIGLEILQKDGDKLVEALKLGRMAAARSGNDFLYITDSDGKYRLYIHTPGAPGGGRREFPKDEKHTAIIRNIAQVSDSLFSVEYNKEFDVRGVMASAEEGILSMFPGNCRDADEDIEFIIPPSGASGNTRE